MQLSRSLNVSIPSMRPTQLVFLFSASLAQAEPSQVHIK